MSGEGLEPSREGVPSAFEADASAVPPPRHKRVGRGCGNRTRLNPKVPGFKPVRMPSPPTPYTLNTHLKKNNVGRRGGI